jgi:hypothetical protein
MQNQERENSKNVGNVNQIFKLELVKDKYVIKALYLGAWVIGLFALGFLFKAINYTADNFKKLNATLER